MPGSEAGMNWPLKAGEDPGGWPRVLVRRLVCPVGWAAQEMREGLGDLDSNSGVMKNHHMFLT